MIQSWDFAVVKPIPDYLKLHVEEGAPSEAPPVDDIPGLAEYFRCFEAATGWALEIEAAGEVSKWSEGEVLPDELDSFRLRLKPWPAAAEEEASSESSTPVELYKARQLANAMNGLVGELQLTRRELWTREAELAVGIPVTARDDEDTHLAIRLEAILKGGAKAVGCQAAALYLLDDATTQLKMRACWGLPKKRLLAPARPLRGAVGDLEALVGHAVVMEDTALLPHWKVPESYPAAVCVPVSSPTEPLGTLWFFCDRGRDFSEDQTNLVEIIAGRIASELQRATLLSECVSSKELDRELVRAERWQLERLPNIKPLLEDWEVAGWTSSAHRLGRAFHDWFVPPDGSLAVALGSAEGSMMESALTLAALHASLRAHSSYSHDAGQMVAQANETFWNSSAGGQFASLFYGLIQPETGRCLWSRMGGIEAFVIGPDQVIRLPGATTLLGAEPDAPSQRHDLILQPRDTLMLVSQGLLGNASQAVPGLSGWLGQIRQDQPSLAAERLLEGVQRFLENECATEMDGAMLAISRRN